MTRLEKYHRSITLGIVLLLITLCGLIVFTIRHNQVRSAPTKVPNVAQSTPIATTTSPTPIERVPAVDIKPAPTELPPPIPISPTATPLLSYITVTGGCNYDFSDECLRVRSGPGLDFPVVASLRNNMVLRIDNEKPTVADGYTWYKIIFDETLRYPERLKDDWYVAADFVESFTDVGPLTSNVDASTTSTKRIVVDRSEQSLTAYEGSEIFMQADISTGLALTPTPRGTFAIYKKTPSRYMQGPLPGISNQYYDLPGVSWNLYFTVEGAVIHGAYWHQSFGKQYSHGCVNMLTNEARTLYMWADIGTTVQVQD